MDRRRSFTWVGDVVWAMSALIDEPRAAGQVFNIGNSHETSIRSLAQRVCGLTGSNSKLVFTAYEQAFDSSFEDLPRRVPDISKLRRLIAYEPRVQLDGIIKSADSVLECSDRTAVKGGGTARPAERCDARACAAVTCAALHLRRCERSFGGSRQR